MANALSGRGKGRLSCLSKDPTLIASARARIRIADNRLPDCTLRAHDRRGADRLAGCRGDFRHPGCSAGRSGRLATQRGVRGLRRVVSRADHGLVCGCGRDGRHALPVDGVHRRSVAAVVLGRAGKRVGGASLLPHRVPRGRTRGDERPERLRLVHLCGARR